MMRMLFGAAAMAALVPLAATAHGPTRQKVTLTVEIAVPSAEVWEAVGKFDDMGWHPAIFATEGDGGSVIDAIRVLTLGEAGGPTISEVLYKYSDERRSYSYRITDVDVEVLPVTNCSVHLTVKDGADCGSLVELRGAFYRGYPNNDPPEHLNDAAAVDAG